MIDKEEKNITTILNFFENVHFKGVFRDYQQTVLDNADKHLSDGHIHIVAAPGSGKTILGLELIRRLNAPAIILSPTTTIRNQWGDRFVTSFLDDAAKENDYVSYSLLDIKPLTSVTYQALHAAINRLRDAGNSVDDSEELVDVEQQGGDYSGFDLLQVCKDCGVKTVCLDEAHHLKQEWQKALESFKEKLGDDIKVISLTATPPYDSMPDEWKRYIDCCGEIDEEIFVPQLIGQYTLCPHQDYIYFNYPTTEERKKLEERKSRSKEALQEVIASQAFCRLISEIILTLDSPTDKTEFIYDNAMDFAVLLELAARNGTNIPTKYFKKLIGSRGILKIKLDAVDRALGTIIYSESFSIFSEELKQILSAYGMIEKKRICLASNERMDKMLVSSSGKLESIVHIAKSEYGNLGSRLQMLVLTDYIRKDLTKFIGTSGDINLIGTVSVFEHIRRNLPDEAGVGVLSGSLVILPGSAVEISKRIADKYGVSITFSPFENTGHVKAVISGGNKSKVKVVSRLFEEGHIHILVGTKSLLGEGWDSPCINSLILASFVGSFVLSNQMRGRAIRMDKNHPDKVANIWHLVTIEPPMLFAKSIREKFDLLLFDDKNKIHSADYETLKRRFRCFIAPTYSSGGIRSGIERVDIIKPPFTEDKIHKINEEMLKRAEDRAAVCGQWNACTEDTSKIIHENVSASKDFMPKKAVFMNFFLLSMYLSAQSALFAGIGRGIFKGLFQGNNLLFGLLALALSLIVSFFLLKGLFLLIKRFSPKRLLKSLGNAILLTLKETHGFSSSAAVKVSSDNLDLSIVITIENATVHEQNIFSSAVSEMLSPIRSPRYMIIKKDIFNKYRCFTSFACPMIIGKKKEMAKTFQKYLSAECGRFVAVYVHNDEGRKLLFKCRHLSMIMRNEHIKRFIGVR